MMQTKLSVNEFLAAGAILSSFQGGFWVGWGHSEKSRGAHPLSEGWNVYAPDFFLRDPTPWWNFSYCQRITREDLILAIRSEAKPFHLKWEEPSLGQFSEVFSELFQQFKLKALKKAVPVVFEESQFQLGSNEKAQLLLRLLENTSDVPVQLYGAWNEQEGILGATPELLFRADRFGQVRTGALAGTRLRGSSLPPLLKDPKELEEHQIVIDGIGESLFSLGPIKIGQTRELHLPNLSHLFTPISVDLSASIEGKNRIELFQSLVDRLHPTPALGAFPREAGKQWLLNQSCYQNRRRFGAPFGAIWDTGESECIVSIRNLQWTDQTVSLGAGCGVIASSQIHREWEEIKGKIRAVKRVFHV